MALDVMFVINSILLGIGLAMDAFSVSLANGFNDLNMKKSKTFGIALTFALFQFAMPLIGWVCVHYLVSQFKIFEHFIPWIALILLGFIGGRMIVEYFANKNKEEEDAAPIKKLGFWALIVQGIATSIDALSVGFTIAEYDIFSAILASGIIAVVTFGLCLAGVVLGKKFGTKIGKKADLVGGIILVAIGLEIFVTNIISLYF